MINVKLRRYSKGEEDNRDVRYEICYYYSFWLRVKMSYLANAAVMTRPKNIMLENILKFHGSLIVMLFQKEFR